MKSANETGPSRRMRSRSRSPRVTSGLRARASHYIFGGETPPTLRLRRCGALLSPRRPLRVAARFPPDDRGILGRRLDLDGEAPRRLEGGRQGSRPLRAAVSVGRAPARRRPRESSLATAALGPHVPGEFNALTPALSRRERE